MHEMWRSGKGARDLRVDKDKNGRQVMWALLYVCSRMEEGYAVCLVGLPLHDEIQREMLLLLVRGKCLV